MLLSRRANPPADHRSDEGPSSARQSSPSVSRCSSSSSASSRSSSSSASSSLSHPDDDHHRHRRHKSRRRADSSLFCDRLQPPVGETSSGPRIPQCSGCRQAILDHFYYTIRDQMRHESCAVCSVCSADLTEVCFFHNDQLLCRRDYDRLYAIRCANCYQPMRSHELFMCTRPPSRPTTDDHIDNWRRQQACATSEKGTALTDVVVFHVPCFTCIVCNTPLAAGDAYAIDRASGRPICRTDYYSTSSVPPSDHHYRVGPQRTSAIEVAGRAATTTATGVSAVKRMRTSLTDDQRAFLQTAYEVDSRPSKSAREALAADLCVPVRVVQVWFQNQRARDKRAAVSAASHQPSVDSQLTTGRDQPSLEEHANGSGATGFTPSPRSSEGSVSGCTDQYTPEVLGKGVK